MGTGIESGSTGAPGRLGVLVALAVEAPGVLPRAPAGLVALASIGATTLGVMISGVGPRRARAAAARLCREFRPDCLLSLGTAGAVRAGLRAGDLIVAEQVAYRGAVIVLEGPYLTELKRRLGGRPPCESGDARLLGVPGGKPAFWTGEVQTLDRPALARRGLRASALVVDMEAYAVAEVAAAHGLPALAVKAVSDVVPEQKTVLGTAAWLWRLKRDAGVARAALDTFARAYFDPTA